MQRILQQTVGALSTAMELRDPYTAGHQYKVARVAAAIAREMGLSKDRVEGITVAGNLHDIGKMSIPSEILTRPGKLTELEFKLIKTHPQVGYEMLQEIEFDWPVAEIVQQHHERINGAGYPNGLNNKDILLEAKILAVADVVEAIASHRPYRPALGLNHALEEIAKGKGSLYDPEVVEACLKLFKLRNYRIAE
jgi:putative nucleotidyltransferase with HDIG domain